MVPISIGKLIKKREFAPVLSRLIGALATSVIIEDHAGQLLLSTEGAKRRTGYPVSVAGEIIGYVNGSRQVASLASLLAYQAELELEKRSPAKGSLNGYKETDLLCDMVERVSSCLNGKELPRLVVEQAKKALRLSSVAVLLLDKHGELMEPVAVHGDELDAALPVRLGVGIAGSVWASGRAEIVNEVQADPRALAGSLRVASLMCAPLKAKGAVVGVILLGSGEPVNYGDEELKLLSGLATLASVALGNAALYEQLQEAFYTTVYTLAETIEKRDPYTGNHTKRVMEYSLAIGRTLGLGEADMTRLQLGAVLHGQDRGTGQRAAQGVEPDQRGLRAGKAARRLRRGDDQRRLRAENRHPRGTPAPREIRRQRLPRRPEGGRDRHHRPDHRGGRFLRRHDQRPPLPQGTDHRPGLRRVEKILRLPVRSRDGERLFRLQRDRGLFLRQLQAKEPGDAGEGVRRPVVCLDAGAAPCEKNLQACFRAGTRLSPNPPLCSPQSQGETFSWRHPKNS